jgi:DNA-binding NtrC family response regulator
LNPLGCEFLLQDGESAMFVNREKEMIEVALEESRGRIFGPTGAAVKLGIPRSTLESKIKSLRINKYRNTGLEPKSVRSGK